MAQRRTNKKSIGISRQFINRSIDNCCSIIVGKSFHLLQVIAYQFDKLNVVGHKSTSTCDLTEPATRLGRLDGFILPGKLQPLGEPVGIRWLPIACSVLQRNFRIAG